ncbi:MAG: hypothetical protein DRJ31_08795 [Candidatus Methanomethylicota archaeon]|uniref:Uncharacterized protein n=1 Tax=Thermoproteota archaeon TaxID=2056631 RepID=A0A497EKI8_9CREN|nr:MAG: hypothetical protein DRJ31_08795 [Candidatus Verstraetearchaeota archaeon]
MIVLAEKADVREGFQRILGEWIQELLEDVPGEEISIERSSDGWIILGPDDELVKSTIRLQARIPPIASENPPYTARIARISEGRVLVEYPDVRGETVRRSISPSSLAASLGYVGGDPISFLENAGLCEGGPISISANLPSLIQSKLLAKQVLRGLNRLLILNAIAPEVEEVLASDGIRGLIADYESLTLSAHIAYVRIGVKLEKASEKVSEGFENISKDIVVKPLSWDRLIEYWKPIPYEGLFFDGSY